MIHPVNLVEIINKQNIKVYILASDDKKIRLSKPAVFIYLFKGSIQRPYLSAK